MLASGIHATLARGLIKICTLSCKNISVRFREWLAHVRHSAFLGWAREHFDRYSQNVAGMFLHNFIHTVITVPCSPLQTSTLPPGTGLLPSQSHLLNEFPAGPPGEVQRRPRRPRDGPPGPAEVAGQGTPTSASVDIARQPCKVCQISLLPKCRLFLWNYELWWHLVTMSDVYFSYFYNIAR